MGFLRDGCAFLPSLADAAACEQALAALPDDSRAGTRRLLSQLWCRDLAAALRDSSALSGLLPAGSVAVQCTHFEKSADLNWGVAVHQDVSVPVAGRVAHPLLRGWSEKEGAVHVQPPSELLEQMVAVRLHLDDCGEDDGPLRVWPGTHLQGVLTDERTTQLRDAVSPLHCLRG